MGWLDLRFDTYGIATQIFIIIIINIADEARGQYEANPVLWLATRGGKMSPSCQSSHLDLGQYIPNEAIANGC